MIWGSWFLEKPSCKGVEETRKQQTYLYVLLPMIKK